MAPSNSSSPPTGGTNASLLQCGRRSRRQTGGRGPDPNAGPMGPRTRGCSPDFIKCDVEGAELLVFRGGRARHCCVSTTPSCLPSCCANGPSPLATTPTTCWLFSVPLSVTSCLCGGRGCGVQPASTEVTDATARNQLCVLASPRRTARCDCTAQGGLVMTPAVAVQFARWRVRIRTLALDAWSTSAKASHIGSALSIADIVSVLYHQRSKRGPGSNPQAAAARPLHSEQGARLCSGVRCAGRARLLSQESSCSSATDRTIRHFDEPHQPQGGRGGVFDRFAGPWPPLWHRQSLGRQAAPGGRLENLCAAQRWRTGAKAATGKPCMFAAHHRLDNLVAIIDYNKLQSLTTVDADTAHRAPGCQICSLSAGAYKRGGRARPRSLWLNRPGRYALGAAGQPVGTHCTHHQGQGRELHGELRWTGTTASPKGDAQDLAQAWPNWTRVSPPMRNAFIEELVALATPSTLR